MMQVIGLGGMLVGGWHSAAMIIGAGIGSPSGRPDDSYYATAALMVGIPALVFLAGWSWVVSGFLAAPKRPREAISGDTSRR